VSAESMVVVVDRLTSSLADMSVIHHIKKSGVSHRHSNDTSVGRSPAASVYRTASIRNMLTVQQLSETPRTTLMLNTDPGL